MSVTSAELPTLKPDSLRTNIQAIGLRLASSALAAGIVSAPVAAQYGLEHAEATDTFGPAPIILKYNGDDNSQIKALSTTVYTPVGAERAGLGLGLRAELNVPPDTNVSEFFDNNFWQKTVAQYSDPEATAKGYETLLRKDLYNDTSNQWLILTTIGGLATFAIRQGASKRTINPTTKGFIATAGVALAASSIYAGVNAYNWQQESKVPEGGYKVDSLNGTILEGTVTDNTTAEALLEKGATVGKLFQDRIKAENERFETAMSASFEGQKTLIEAPREGEEAVIHTSDYHSNMMATEFTRIAIEYVTQTHPGVFIAVLDTGDRTYGTGGERSALEKQFEAANGLPVYGAAGDHDGEVTIKIQEEIGLNVINNEVVRVANMGVLGMTDRVYKPLLGREEIRVDVETDELLGERAREIAEEENPNIVLLHKGQAVSGFLDIDTIKSIEPNPSDYRTFKDDNVEDVPAAAVFYGHWHEKVEPRVIFNSDGTWTPIIELPTTGGAVEASTYANFSLPNAPPKKPASFMITYRNTKSGLVTGYQWVELHPTAEVIILPRVDIGSEDGQPFEVDEGFQAAPAEQSKKPLTSE